LINLFVFVNAAAALSILIRRKNRGKSSFLARLHGLFAMKYVSKYVQSIATSVVRGGQHSLKNEQLKIANIVLKYIQ